MLTSPFTEHKAKPLRLTQQFMLTSLFIVVLGLVGIGWWTGEQIKAGVIRETGATTALYVQSFVSPALQELNQGETLLPEHITLLSKLTNSIVLDRQIVSFKVWGTDGQILYSTSPSLIGQFFPVDGDLALSLQGAITANISNLEDAENLVERKGFKRLFEIYTPIFQDGTNRIIADAEIYFTVSELEKDIAAAQQRSWLAVGLIMLAVYLLLVGFMYLADRIITRQQNELNNRVSQLSSALAQNEELYDRVRRATNNATALNEHFLRRIGAELHDGPAQDISLALLRLDRVAEHLAEPAGKAGNSNEGDLESIQRSMRHALQEVRATASGLGLPQIDSLSLADTLTRVVHIHERRTNTTVALSLNTLPAQVSLPIKIGLYRFVQEALSNAFYHAACAGQQVMAKYNVGLLSVEVSDEGPGFDTSKLGSLENHLGLSGMRDRIECLEGIFRIESAPRQGTKVIARLLLRPEDIKE